MVGNNNKHHSIFLAILLITSMILFSCVVYADISSDDKRIEKELVSEHGRINFYDVDDELQIDSRDYYIDEHTVAFRSENYRKDVRRIINRDDREFTAQVNLNNVNWSMLGYTQEDIRNESMGFILDLYKHDNYTTNKQRIIDEGQHYKTLLVPHEDKQNVSFEVDEFSSITINILNIDYDNSDNVNLEIDYLGTVDFTDPEEPDFSIWYEADVIASEGYAPSMPTSDSFSYYQQPMNYPKYNINHDKPGRFEARVVILIGVTGYYSSYKEYALGYSTETQNADNVDSTSARLNTYVESRGANAFYNDGTELSSADMSFIYREVGSTSGWSTTSTTESYLFRNYQDTVTGLSPDTDYEFKGVLTQDGTQYQSYETKTFTTETEAEPYVETNPATTIQDTSASLNGYVDLGGETSVDGWFSYREGTEGEFTKISASVQQLTTTTSFDYSLTGLTACTTYDFKAGIDYDVSSSKVGSIESFETTGCPEPEPAEGLLEGLLSYWKLDETTGTNFVDSHGTNDGTGINEVISGGDGKINAGADFTQGDDYIDLKDDYTNLQIREPLSVSAWFKPSDVTTHGIIVGVGQSGHYGGWWFMIYGGELYFRRGDGSGSTSARFSVNTDGLNLQNDQWAYVTAVLHNDNTDIASTDFYINGDLWEGTKQTSGDGDGYIIFTEDYADIGAARRIDYRESFFDGLIDEVAIYNRTLSANEVTELYNTGDGLSYDSFSPDAPPSINLIGHSDVGYSSATLQGEVTDMGDYESVELFFLYGLTEATVGTNEVCNTNLVSTMSVNCEISNLDSDTEYHYQMGVAYDGNTNYTNIQTLNTDKISPLVSTLEPIDVELENATLRADVTSLGDYNSIDVFFEYRLAGTQSYSMVENSLSTRTETGIYSYNANVFSEGLTYDVRAVVNYNGGSTNTVEETFTTALPFLAPVYTDVSVDSITQTSANLKTDIELNEAELPFDVYFLYRQATDTDWLYTTPEFIETDPGLSLQHNEVLSDLLLNTSYEYRVYFDYYYANETYTLMSSIESFNTLPEEPAIPEETFTDFFDIFTGGNSQMRFVVAMVLILGMAIMGFQVMKTVLGAMLFGVFGLVLSVIIGLMSVWVVVLIVLLALLPIIYKMFLGGN